MKFKNGLKRIVVSVMTVAIIFSAFSVCGFGANSFSADAANSNAKQIFDYLTSDMGLNSAAACGVLANIECESNFNPNLYGDSGNSYGICQWNTSRFENLKAFCDVNGLSWTSLKGQLAFLKYELLRCPGDTGNIYKYLSVENTSDGAYQAGYNWCYYFERPANRAVKSENRGNMAKNNYWPVYKIVSNLGDVNNDGKINSSDALLVLEHSVGKKILTASQFTAADLNSNGKVNSDDALIILKISTGKESINNYK